MMRFTPKYENLLEMHFQLQKAIVATTVVRVSDLSRNVSIPKAELTFADTIIQHDS